MDYPIKVLYKKRDEARLEMDRCEANGNEGDAKTILGRIFEISKALRILTKEYEKSK